MSFSDFYINRETKIEILPTDRLNLVRDLFVPGDNFISVFRPVKGSFVVNRLHDSFLPEFKLLMKHEKYSIDDALSLAIQRCNYSCICPPADPELRPEQGAMVLVAYITPDNTMTFAQVGTITLKRRQEQGFIPKKRRSVPITENHTFDNKAELERLLASIIFKENYKEGDEIQLLNYMAITEGFIKEFSIPEGQLKNKLQQNIPSRFIGHPSWCSMGGEFEETIVNTKPYIKTVFL